MGIIYNNPGVERANDTPSSAASPLPNDTSERERKTATALFALLKRL